MEKISFYEENDIIYKKVEYEDGTVVCSIYDEEEHITTQEPTEEELFQAEMLLNQMQIISTQQEQDEVLAEILLNQLGV